MTFKALVVEETGGADVVAAIKELTEDQLPAGNVTVAVEYTTVNYKDGLCMATSDSTNCSLPIAARQMTSRSSTSNDGERKEVTWHNFCIQKLYQRATDSSLYIGFGDRRLDLETVDLSVVVVDHSILETYDATIKQ